MEIYPKMLIRMSLFFFMNSAILSASSDSIIPIKSFSQIDFDEITSDQSVFFDIDFVLIEPKDSVRHHVHLKHVIEAFEGHVSDPEMETCISLMFRDGEQRVIEPIVIEKIRDLREKKVNVNALTSSRIGSFGEISSAEDMRYRLLKNFGFSWSFEEDVHSFEELKKEDETCTPLFFKGIILVDGYPKGSSLGAFLDWKKLSPSKVIFMDDSLKNLLSVKEECEKRSIPFLGYQYFGKSNPPLDEEMMHKQFRYLSQHRIWTADSKWQKDIKPPGKKRKIEKSEESTTDEELMIPGSKITDHSVPDSPNPLGFVNREGLKSDDHRDLFFQIKECE
jgi:hypothetical protein